MNYSEMKTLSTDYATTTSELKDAQATNRTVTVVPMREDGRSNLLVSLVDGLAVLPPCYCDISMRPDGSNAHIVATKYLDRPTHCKVIGTFDYNGKTAMLLDHTTVQEEARDELIAKGCGTIVDATITGLASFGAFCALDEGLCALIPISRISINRIEQPSDFLTIGQHIKAVVSSIDEGDRIVLSMRELLGTWEQKAAGLSDGDCVVGYVRRSEEYGTFVQLGGNLAGLADVSPLAYGTKVAAFVRKIEPSRMKVKVSIIPLENDGVKPSLKFYVPESGHLDSWTYSPACCERFVGTSFSEKVSV